MAEMTLTKPRTRKRRIRRALLFVVLGLAGLCVLAMAAGAISNALLPDPPAQVAELDTLGEARVAEALRLKAAVGDQVWPGYGTMDIPLLVWNDNYAFLYGYAGDPPPGWEQLDAGPVAGAPVYRHEGGNFQAFSEQVVGDVYAGSLSTKAAIDIALRETFEEVLPPVVEDVFPYRLLIQPTEVYVGGLLHEAFHAYQQMAMGGRVQDAEEAYRSADDYAAEVEGMRDGWKAEVGLLIDALKAGTDEEARALVAEWLGVRAARHEAAGLGTDLVLYEQRYEWLEGLAKYVELGVWETVAGTEGYEPLPALDADPEFHDYGRFRSRWNSELLTMRNMAGGEGDSLFYYTGMAQARLLDRLMPGWKTVAEQEGVWLEDLLAEAISG